MEDFIPTIDLTFVKDAIETAKTTVQYLLRAWSSEFLVFPYVMRTLLSLVFVVRLLCEIFDVRGVKFEVPSVGYIGVYADI